MMRGYGIAYLIGIRGMTIASYGNGESVFEMLPASEAVFMKTSAAENYGEMTTKTTLDNY